MSVSFWCVEQCIKLTYLVLKFGITLQFNTVASVGASCYAAVISCGAIVTS